MILRDLFEMCDNLGNGSRIVVRDAAFYHVDEGTYPEMHARYGNKRIMGFRIDDDRHATVYLAGVNK